jgi:hypothetical protein
MIGGSIRRLDISIEISGRHDFAVAHSLEGQSYKRRFLLRELLDFSAASARNLLRLRGFNPG